MRPPPPHAAHERKPRAPELTAIFGFFGLALGVVALGLGNEGSTDTRLWSAAAGSVAIGGACVAFVRQRNRAEGGPLFARMGPATVILYTLSFGAFSLAWLAPQSGASQVIEPSQIPGGVAVSMVGLVALTLGYVVGPTAALVHGARRLVTTVFREGSWTLRVPSIALVLYAIGTAIRGLRLSTGQYGYLQDAAQTLSTPSSSGQVLSLFESLTTIALVIAAIDCFMLGRSARSRVVLVGLSGMEIGVGLFSASKQGVLFTIVTLALVKAFSGQRVRVVSVIGVAVLVSLLFPFTSDYRSSIRGSESGQIAPGTALAEIPTVVGRTAEDATPRSVALDGPSAVARRLRQVDNVALVRQKTPRAIPHRPWTDLAIGPLVATVPRPLWPSKPLISTGREFAQDYYELPPSVFSANAVTLPGDLYRHGGIVPLGIGMAVFGLILRLFDSSLSPSKDPRHLIVYVPLFLHIIKLESDVTVFVVGLVQLMLFSALTSWLVFARSGIPHHRSHRSPGGAVRARTGR